MRALRVGWFISVAATALLVVLLLWAVAISRQAYPWFPTLRIAIPGFRLHMRELVLLTLILLPFSAVLIARALQILRPEANYRSRLPGLGLVARCCAASSCLILATLGYYTYWSPVGDFIMGRPAESAKTPIQLSDKNVKFPALPLLAPDPYGWSLKDLSGNPAPMALFKGKPLFLNFWATWCGPCRKEMPYIEDLYKTMKDEGIGFALVSNEDLETVKQFTTANAYTFPVYVSETDPPAPFELGAIPATYLLAPDGRVAVKHTGSMDWSGPRTQDFLRALKAELQPAAAPQGN